MYSSVAYELHQIDPNLGMERDEGERRLVPLRAVLRCVANKVGRPDLVNPASGNSIGAMLSSNESSDSGFVALESIMSSSSYLKARVCLLSSASKVLSTSEADELDDAQRHQCVAVKYTDTVVLKGYEDDNLKANVLVTLPDDVCPGQRSAKMNICRTSEFGVHISIVSSKGTRKYIEAQGLPEKLLNNLFAPIDKDIAQSATGVPQRERELPDYLKAELANFLEKRIRLHVLCSASVATNVTRRVVIDHAYLCTDAAKPHSARAERLLYITARLHSSSSSCICAAHGLPCNNTGSVAVVVETCGRRLEKMYNCFRCPCHEASLGQDGNAKRSLGGLCTEGTRISISCYHNGKQTSKGVRIESFGLTEYDRTELANILFNMAEFEACTFASYQKGRPTDRDYIERCANALKIKFARSTEELERKRTLSQSSDALDAEEMCKRDAVAVELLRTGGLVRDYYKSGQRRNMPYIKRRKSANCTPNDANIDLKVLQGYWYLFPKA